MPVEKQFPVYGDNGLRGTLTAASRFLDNTPEKKIRLEDGREITVPSEMLEAQRDGSFYLHSPIGAARPEASNTTNKVPSKNVNDAAYDRARQPPMPQETPMGRPEQAGTEPPPSMAANPESVQVPPGEPLFREDCEIERVTVRRLLDRPAETRQEGDTLIVPLMEEVWVVEKRLLLREELRITRRKNQVADSHTRALRREDLEKAG
jgi:hypothetical protein